MHRVVPITDHDHRHLAVIEGDVVSGIRYLAVVTDIDPGVSPDAGHLQIEHIGICIDAPVQVLVLHKRTQICICISHIVPSREAIIGQSCSSSPRIIAIASASRGLGGLALTLKSYISWLSAAARLAAAGLPDRYCFGHTCPA